MTELSFHVEPDAWVSVAELLTMFHPHNSQTRNPAELAAIKRHLSDEGFTAEMIVVNPHNKKIVSGHGRTQAAHELGYTGTLPVVYREYKTEAEHRRAMLRWNLARGHQDEAKEAAEFAALLAEFDRKDLAADFGLVDGEFEALLKEFAPPTPLEDPGPQTDRAEELRQVWGVELGQMWQLGAHRLICGDCTNAAVVERVMGGERIDCITTDPPYGVDYDGGTTKREKLQGDESPALYFPALSCWKSHCADSVALYLWYADGDQAVAQAVAQAGWQVRRNLIWNKNQAQYGALSQQYKQKHEPFLYCHLKGKAPYWAGDGAEVTVWDIDRESVNEFHPTQKPPALFARAIQNSSTAGANVFDGFSGSGTTLIACEQLSRKCRAVEISPAYVAVALQRWANMTGQTPELLPDA